MSDSRLVLTRAELKDLSGWKQKSKITQWLIREGYAFSMGPKDWPRVLRHELERRPSSVVQSTKRVEPNIKALELRQGAIRGKAKKD